MTEKSLWCCSDGFYTADVRQSEDTYRQTHDKSQVCMLYYTNVHIYELLICEFMFKLLQFWTASLFETLTVSKVVKQTLNGSYINCPFDWQAKGWEGFCWHSLSEWSADCLAEYQSRTGCNTWKPQKNWTAFTRWAQMSDKDVKRKW